MDHAINSINPSIIKAHLIRRGVISKEDGVLIHVYQPNLNRKNADEIRSFKVSIPSELGIYLTLGVDLGDLYERTLAFTNANAAITCKPLFYLKEEGIDYLGLDYFGIGNLDECLDQNIISLNQANAAISQIKESLAKTVAPSTYEAMHAEVQLLENEISTISKLSAYDRDFITTKLFPIVYQELKSLIPMTYWTNGDFISRNIVVGENNVAKLIDYEFSHRTHFPELDYFRLKTFSPHSAHFDIPKLSQSITLLGWLEHLVTSYKSQKLEPFAREYIHIANNLIKSL